MAVNLPNGFYEVRGWIGFLRSKEMVFSRVQDSIKGERQDGSRGLTREQNVVG